MTEQIGTCDLRLQQHFSLIKDIDITLQKMNSIAFQSGAFRHEDHIPGQSYSAYNKETLLNNLIRKGHHSCELFLQELADEGYQKEVDICLSEHNDDYNVNDQLNNVTSENIEQNFDYITSNLEIGIVLDMLFERRIVTINEHDQVQRQSTRSEKRRTILTLLLSRPNTNWLFGFIRVLKDTGHIILLERLRQHVNNGQVLELAELPYVQLGHTIPLPNDFIARLSSNFTQRVERSVINLQRIQQVMQETLHTGVIEIREGSIYFYLSTFSPDTILTILNGKGDAKLITFLQRLFSENRYLLHQFPKDTIVQFELEEKPEDSFIDTFYGRWKSQIPTNKDEFCSGCYQAILRANYKTVLDEIEDDVIQDTLTRLEKLEKPNDQLHSSRCLLKNKTRSEKAFTFLQYVLGNEHVLYEFSKALGNHSRVELERVKCRNCSSPEGTLIPSEPRKRIFHFTIRMNNFDQIEITNIENKLMTPSVALRPILDDKIATALREPPEHMSLEELPATDKYRIVVIEIEETEYPRELQILTEHQLHVCKIPHFGLTPITGESLRGVKECILSARPGPHAFLLVTNLYDPYSLRTFLKNCDEYFGPDFMQFIIPIFTTNSKPDEHAVLKVEHDIEHLLPKLRSFQPHEHRFIVFENNASKSETVFQIYKLTKLIAKMQMVNTGNKKYYSNTSFEKFEKAVQKLEKAAHKSEKAVHKSEKAVHKSEKFDQKITQLPLMMYTLKKTP